MQRSCRTPSSWARLGIDSAQSCSPTGEAEPGPRGSQHPALGTPTSYQAGNLVWVPRWVCGFQLAAHPATPQHPALHGHSMECPQLTHCILHPSRQELPGWAGGPQLQLFKALSPQLQVIMLMPTLIPSPAASALPFFTQGNAKAMSPCYATDREHRHIEDSFKELY